MHIATLIRLDDYPSMPHFGGISHIIALICLDELACICLDDLATMPRQ